jgi:hypothetical protein
LAFRELERHFRQVIKIAPDNFAFNVSIASDKGDHAATKVSDYLPTVVIYTFLLIETGGPGAVSLCNRLLNEAQTHFGTYRQCDGDNNADTHGPHDILLGRIRSATLMQITNH